MPRLQFAVCTIEEGFVGIVRVERRISDFVVDSIGDGRFVHRMFLILLLVMNRTHIGWGGAVEAGGGHDEVEVEVSQTDAEAKETEEGENGKVGEVDRLSVGRRGIHNYYFMQNVGAKVKRSKCPKRGGGGGGAGGSVRLEAGPRQFLLQLSFGASILNRVLTLR